MTSSSNSGWNCTPQTQDPILKAWLAGWELTANSTAPEGNSTTDSWCVACAGLDDQERFLRNFPGHRVHFSHLDEIFNPLDRGFYGKGQAATDDFGWGSSVWRSDFREPPRRRGPGPWPLKTFLSRPFRVDAILARRDRSTVFRPRGSIPRIWPS